MKLKHNLPVFITGLITVCVYLAILYFKKALKQCLAFKLNNLIDAPLTLAFHQRMKE